MNAKPEPNAEDESGTEDAPDADSVATPKGSDTKSSETKSSTMTPERRKLRRRRRIRRALIVLVVVGAILRIALGYALPGIISSAFEAQGFHAEVERIDLSLLSADLELWHLEVRDLDTGAPYFHTEYCRADVAVSELFFGRLVVRRVESDGVDVYIERAADGTIPMVERLGSNHSTAEPEPASTPTEAADSGGVTSLEPPLVLNALRFQHANIHWTDRTVTPAIEERFILHLRLSDLGHPTRPTRTSVELTVPGLLDSLRLQGTARTSTDRIDAELSLAVDGLQAVRLGRYIEALTGRPVEEHWEARGTLRTGLTRDPADGSLEATFEFLDGFARAGSLARVQLTGAELVGALPAGRPPAVTTCTLAAGEAELSLPWKRGRELPLQANLVAATVSTENDERRWKAELSLPGMIEEWTIEGALRPTEDGWQGSLTSSVRGVRPERVAPLLAEHGIELLDGADAGSATLEFDVADSSDGLVASVALKDIEWRTEGSESSAFALDEVAIRNVRLGTGGAGTSIDTIEVVGPRLRVNRRLDQSIHFGSFTYRPPSTPAAVGHPNNPSGDRSTATPSDTVPDPTVANTPVENPTPFAIHRIEWRGSRVEFTDQVVDPVGHIVVLDDVALSVTDFTWPLPAPSQPCVVEFTSTIPGAVDQFTARVSASTEGTRTAISGSATISGARTETLQPYAAAAEVDLEPIVGSLSLDFAGQYDPAAGIAGLQVQRGELTDDRLTPPRVVAAIDELEATLTASDDAQQIDVVGRGSAHGIDTITLTSSATLPVTNNRDGATRATIELEIEGIDGAELALPNGIECTLRDGALSLSSNVTLGAAVDGGSALDVALEQLRIADGPAPLLSVDEVSAVASRLDAHTNTYVVDQLAVRGVRTSIVREADGAIALVGFRLPVRAAPSADDPPDNATTTAGLDRKPPPEPTPLPAAESPRPDPPTIRVGSVALELASVRYHDLATGGAPIELSSRLSNPEPWVVLDEEPEAITPLRLELDGSLAPLIGTLKGSLELSPFASRPELRVDFALQDCDGSALAEVAPALTDPEAETSIDAAGLDGGTVRGELWVGLQLSRRSPLEVDLSRPIRLEARARNLLIEDASGRALVGVRGIEVPSGTFDPRAPSLRLGELVIDTPIGHVVQHEDGVELAGVRIRNQPSSAPEDTSPDDSAETAASTETDETSAATPTAVSPPPVKSSFAFSIGTIIVSGIDGSLENRALDPPWRYALGDLDVEVRGFESALTRPIVVAARLVGAEVPVQLDDETRQIRTFSEIIVDGQIMPPSPATGGVPRGRIVTTVRGLQLLAFRSLAAAQQITIDDGVFDLELDLEFRDDGSIESNSRAVFTDLEIAEGSEGPIRRYLNLPTPLQVAVFVVRDADGSITLPTSITIPSNGESIPLTQITLALSKAVAGVITDAIAASPFRVTGTLTDLAGLTGRTESVEARLLQAQFRAGATQPAIDAHELATLRETIANDDALAVQLSHSVGRDDWAIAQRRANPPVAESLALAQELRAERRRLMTERRRLSEEAAAALIYGLPHRREETEGEFRRRSAELGAIERAVDRMLALATETSPHRKERRTRAVAVEIAKRRLERTRAELIRVGVDPDRIRVVRPRLDHDDAEPEGPATVEAHTFKR